MAGRRRPEDPPANYRPEYLDRQVIFDIELPAGAAHGPVIDRRELARLRLVSGPKFRAYIAAHSIAWRPGVTRRRHARNRGVHLWSSDSANYPILTAEDRDRLAFGNVDRARKEGREKGRQLLGGPARGRDPDPPSMHPRRPPGMADCSRGRGGGHPDLRNRGK